MRHNVIVMLCDDLGYGDLGCYGSEVNQTPEIDRMAAEGIRFTDFYVASSLCSPSRAALLTGGYPQRCGLGEGENFCVLLPGDAIGLSPETYTMPRMFKEAGYATKIVGKWHLGDQKEFQPCLHGFDEYFGLPYSNDMNTDHFRQDQFHFPPLPLMRNGEIIETDPNQASLTARYLDESLQFIRENHDRNFFLYFSHMYVHEPIYAPYSYLKQSKNGPYGAAVSHIDQTVGAIRRELEHLGIAEDTLLVFLSDNGSNLQNGGTNAPLRGQKASRWDGGFRVPCICCRPGMLEPEERHDLATAMDLLSTFASLADLALPVSTDGRDLFAPPKGEPEFAYYMGEDLVALRLGNWKRHFVTGELFNLEADIGETVDLQHELPEICRKIDTRAAELRLELGDARLGIRGAGCRDAARVENPRTLTEYFAPEYD